MLRETRPVKILGLEKVHQQKNINNLGEKN